MSQQTRTYPDDPSVVESRTRLLQSVAEARDNRDDPLTRAHAADTEPSLVHLIPGTGAPSKRGRKRATKITRRSPREIVELIESAIMQKQNLNMIYVTRDDKEKRLKVNPERLAVNSHGQQVLVASDLTKGERLSYQVVQITRMDVLER